jgi:hypothetical protein
MLAENRTRSWDRFPQLPKARLGSSWKMSTGLDPEHFYNKTLGKVQLVCTESTLLLMGSGIMKSGHSFGIGVQSSGRSSCCFWIGWDHKSVVLVLCCGT